MKLWSMLENKGRIATMLGLILGLVTVVLSIVAFFKFQEYMLLIISIGFGFAMGFFIMPSKLIVKAKGVEIEVVD